MSSRILGNIGIGREASAWVDRENSSVYKLFDVMAKGDLWRARNDTESGLRMR
jgi:hypothetical protein